MATTNNSTTAQQQSLTYRELQAALKPLKQDGKTTIKLNSAFDVLAGEYARLTSNTVSKAVSKAAQEKAAREARQYTYRELQAKLKVLKNEGATAVKLNSKYEVLLEELQRIEQEAAA